VKLISDSKKGLIILNWLVWLFLAIVAIAVEKCLNRYYLSNTNNHWEYMIGYNLGALLLLLVFILCTSISFTFNGFYITLLIVSGCMWFLLCLFAFKADQFAEVTFTSLISQFQFILVSIGGILFFKEVITVNKTLGTLLILAGLVILIRKKDILYNRGIIYKFIAVFSLSVALLLDKKIVSFYEPIIIAVSGYVLPMILSVGLKPSMVIPSWQLAKKLKFKNILLGALGCFGYFALISAFKNTPISIIYPLFQLHVVLTIFLGVIFLKEKKDLQRKVLAALAILAGSIVLKF
jgi:drug/metabolite transporter (DMT)-like permease